MPTPRVRLFAGARTSEHRTTVLQTTWCRLCHVCIHYTVYVRVRSVLGASLSKTPTLTSHGSLFSHLGFRSAGCRASHMMNINPK